MHIVSKNIWISLLVIAVMAGCSNKASRLQKGRVKSVDIYRDAAGLKARSTAERASAIYRVRHMMAPDADIEQHTRTAATELNMLFRKHPNPQLRVFIYPHLSTRDNAPIPGYMTAIHLYDKDQYALPNELLAHQSGASE